MDSIPHMDQTPKYAIQAFKDEINQDRLLKEMPDLDPWRRGDNVQEGGLTCRYQESALTALYIYRGTLTRT